MDTEDHRMTFATGLAGLLIGFVGLFTSICMITTAWLLPASKSDVLHHRQRTLSRPTPRTTPKAPSIGRSNSSPLLIEAPIITTPPKRPRVHPRHVSFSLEHFRKKSPVRGVSPEEDVFTSPLNSHRSSLTTELSLSSQNHCRSDSCDCPSTNATSLVSSSHASPRLSLAMSFRLPAVKKALSGKQKRNSEHQLTISEMLMPMTNDSLVATNEIPYAPPNTTRVKPQRSQTAPMLSLAAIPLAKEIEPTQSIFTNPWPATPTKNILSEPVSGLDQSPKQKSKLRNKLKFCLAFSKDLSSGSKNSFFGFKNKSRPRVDEAVAAKVKAWRLTLAISRPSTPDSVFTSSPSTAYFSQKPETSKQPTERTRPYGPPYNALLPKSSRRKVKVQQTPKTVKEAEIQPVAHTLPSKHIAEDMKENQLSQDPLAYLDYKLDAHLKHLEEQAREEERKKRAALAQLELDFTARLQPPEDEGSEGDVLGSLPPSPSPLSSRLQRPVLRRRFASESWAIPNAPFVS